MHINFECLNFFCPENVRMLSFIMSYTLVNLFNKVLPNLAPILPQNSSGSFCLRKREKIILKYQKILLKLLYNLDCIDKIIVYKEVNLLRLTTKCEIVHII